MIIKRKIYISALYIKNKNYNLIKFLTVNIANLGCDTLVGNLSQFIRENNDETLMI